MSGIPLMIKFSTWLRDNPYGMPSCLPNIIIKLDDDSEHPCRKNIVAAHSRYFRILFSSDPLKKIYHIKNVTKEVFEVFLDFCYKRIIVNVTPKNYFAVKTFADFIMSDMLQDNLKKKFQGKIFYYLTN